MIRGQVATVSVLCLDATGAAVAGVVPIVDVKIDAGAWGTAANAASASDAQGRSSILLDAAEVDGESLSLNWRPPAAEFIPIVQTSTLIDLADIAALVLATPANLLATGAAGEVTTDTASRDASKADVSGLIASGDTVKVAQSAVTSDTDVDVTVTKI